MARKLIDSTAGTYSGLEGWAGPFVDGNDNVYIVGAEDSQGYHVYKAGSNPLVDTWTIQDSSNEPTTIDAAARGSVWQEGTELHLISWDNSAEQYEYSVFRMSDHASADTWGTVDELMEHPTNAPLSPHCYIAVRSDGDLVVAYNGDTDKIMGTDYERADYAYEEGSGWTVGQTIGGGNGEQDFNAKGIGRGASDETWFLYEANGDGDIKIRSLSSTNSTSAVLTHDEPGFSSTSPHVGYYDDAGVEVMTNVWRIATAGYSIQTRDGTLQSELSLSGTDMDSGTTSTCVAIDGTDAYAVYRSGTADDVTYQKSADGGTWGDITTISTATAPAQISANVIDHGGGNVLAVLYEDGGDLYYDEISIVPPASVPPLRRNTLLNHLLRR